MTTRVESTVTYVPIAVEPWLKPWTQMGVAWGIVVVVLSLLAWGGQTVSWSAPETAVRLGLTEAKDEVEPVYWADIRAEALWDTFTLWTLLVAGILLILDISVWTYFGLVGGAVYAYFGGRGVLARLEMQRRGLRIGTPSSVKAAYMFLPLWGVTGLITIIAAAVALSS